MRFITRITTAWVVLVLGAMLCAPVASGQLPGDDGFDAGCCVSPVTPTIPAMPAIADTGAYAGLADCHPFIRVNPAVTVTQPVMIQCDYAQAQITVQFPAGETIGGTIFMKYARTWKAAVGGNTEHPETQVWRFLVNGDLNCSGAALQCVSILPPCLAVTLGIVHWEGHIDYAYTSMTGHEPTWTASLSLNHLHGLYTHDPNSCVPLLGAVSHPFESYHLVVPKTFTFVDNPNLVAFAPPSGPLVADAVRRSMINLPNYTCASEIHIQPLGGLVNFASLGCLGSICAIANPVGCTCLNDTILFGASCAAGPLPASLTFFGVFPGPPLPPNGIASLTIGRWNAGPTVYPWSSILTIYLGVIGTPALTDPNGNPPNPDPCFNQPPLYGNHVVTGVGTYAPDDHNWSVTLFKTVPTPPGCSCGNAVVVDSCVDLCNVLLVSNGFLPGYGCVAGSDLVLNLDH